MYNPYDDEPYSDYDDYDDSHDYNHSQPHNPKFYFKFDVSSGGSLSDWVKKTIDDMLKQDSAKSENYDNFFPVSFPVNDLFSQYTVSGSNPLLYLGNNHYKEQVWKKKYFIHDKLGTQYVLHLQSHAGYFLRQPKYYKGLFEILN